MKKYVVVMPADQTIAFRTEDGGMTIKHPEAKLFDTYEEAVKVARPDWDWIETIDDVSEFKAREDTW